MAKTTSKKGDSYVWQLFEYLGFQDTENATCNYWVLWLSRKGPILKRKSEKKNLQHNWTGSTIQRLLVVELGYCSELAITIIDSITTQQL